MNKAGNVSSLTKIQSGADAREKGRRGGMASGAARRKKASIREAFRHISALPYRDEDTLETLKRAGLPENEINVSVALAWAMVENAMKGNSQMMRNCLEMMEEDPGTQIKERGMQLRESLADKGYTGIAPVVIVDNVAE